MVRPTRYYLLLCSCLCVRVRVVIAKVFRGADTEETGSVEAAVVPSLAVKALSTVKESDLHLIRYRAEAKAGMYVCRLDTVSGNEC